MARIGDNRPDQFAVVGLLKKTPTDLEILKKSVVHLIGWCTRQRRERFSSFSKQCLLSLLHIGKGKDK